jgi:hypothetical protein
VSCIDGNRTKRAQAVANIHRFVADPFMERSQDEGHTIRTGPEPVCERAPYPRYEPGTYEAECISAEIGFDAMYRRWSCVLKFSILSDGSPVWCFLNLGKNPKNGKRSRSRYYRAWVIANGERPRNRQTLSSRLFIGKIFEIEIGDVRQDFEKRDHPKGMIYSVVRRIVRRTYP